MTRPEELLLKYWFSDLMDLIDNIEGWYMNWNFLNARYVIEELNKWDCLEYDIMLGIIEKKLQIDIQKFLYLKLN